MSDLGYEQLFYVVRRNKETNEKVYRWKSQVGWTEPNNRDGAGVWNKSEAKNIIKGFGLCHEVFDYYLEMASPTISKRIICSQEQFDNLYNRLILFFGDLGIKFDGQNSMVPYEISDMFLEELGVDVDKEFLKKLINI